MTGEASGLGDKDIRDVTSLPVRVYSLTDEATIEWRGEASWAIVRVACVLNRDGRWEWEPSPSNRGEDFLSRTRYETAQAALERWLRHVNREG